MLQAIQHAMPLQDLPFVVSSQEQFIGFAAASIFPLAGGKGRSPRKYRIKGTETNEQSICQLDFQSRYSRLRDEHVFDPDLRAVCDANHLCTEAKVRGQ